MLSADWDAEEEVGTEKMRRETNMLQSTGGRLSIALLCEVLFSSTLVLHNRTIVFVDLPLGADDEGVSFVSFFERFYSPCMTVTCPPPINLQVFREFMPQPPIECGRSP